MAFMESLNNNKSPFHSFCIPMSQGRIENVEILIPIEFIRETYRR